MSNRPFAEATTYTTPTNTRDEHTYFQRDSNQRSQQPSGCRPTP